MQLLTGTWVRCHRNLRRGDWSITVAGKVVAHVPEIILGDVSFRVREKARLEVVRRHCRQVHAWALGTVIADCPAAAPRTPITYNPFRSASFIERDRGTPVTACDYVHFTREGAVAVGRMI
jgi:hypothetical protein